VDPGESAEGITGKGAGRETIETGMMMSFKLAFLRKGTSHKAVEVDAVLDGVGVDVVEVAGEDGDIDVIVDQTRCGSNPSVRMLSIRTHMGVAYVMSSDWSKGLGPDPPVIIPKTCPRSFTTIDPESPSAENGVVSGMPKIGRSLLKTLT